MAQAGTEDTNQLLQRARKGDKSAVDMLFSRHRDRLKRMVAARLDRRLARRIDPSDVVQDALVAAHKRIDAYLQRQPVSFYPWLRGLAWDRLVELRRRHLKSQRRTVNREALDDPMVSDESSVQLASYLGAAGSGPSGPVVRAELCQRVRRALAHLNASAREVLMLRFVEQLTAREAAEVVGISESAFKGRQVRALARMRELLDAESEEFL